MAVQQRQHVDAVGCRTFFSGIISMSVLDILGIPSGENHICSGCSTPNCTPCLRAWMKF